MSVHPSCDSSDLAGEISDIRNFLHGWVISLLSAFFSTIDPNWVRADLVFERGKARPKLHPQDQCFVLRMRPTSARFNGPKFGDVDILDKVADVVPEQLLCILWYWAEREWNAQYFSFANPNHCIQLIPGRTEVYFENCDSDVIQNYDPTTQTFDVLGERYTLERLQKEFALEHPRCGEAVHVEYLPPSPNRS